EDLVNISKDFPEPGYPLDQFLVFVLYLLPLEGDELGQPHVQDGVSLELAEVVVLHQPGPCLLYVLGSPEEFHNRVDVLEGDPQAFEYVGSGQCLFQLEFASLADHLLSKLEELAYYLEERHHFGMLVHYRKVDYAEGSLELRVGIKLVED